MKISARPMPTLPVSPMAAMPPGSAGEYFIARLRGGEVAAVGSQPEGGPPIAVWNTYVSVKTLPPASSTLAVVSSALSTDT